MRGDRTHAIHSIPARDPTSPWNVEDLALGEASRPGEGAGTDVGLKPPDQLPARERCSADPEKGTSRGRAGCNPQKSVKYNAKLCPELLMFLYQL